MSIIVTSSTVGSPRIGYHNLFESTTATVTASTETAGFEKENAYDWFGYDWWKPTATGDSWLRASFSGSQLANYMAVWGHNLGTIAGNCKPQYSTDGGTVWTDAASAIAPADDNTLFFTWSDITASDWRILVNGATLPIIAGVQIGEVFPLPKNMETGFTPPSLVPIITSRTAQSESGAFIGGSTLNQGIEGGFTISNQDPVWVRDIWIPFINHFQTPKPFVFVWDYDSHSSEVVLAWKPNGRASELSYTSTLYMGVSLKFEGRL